MEGWMDPARGRRGRRIGACSAPAAAGRARRRACRLLGFAALLTVLGLVLAGSASAIVVRLPSGKTLSYQPLRHASRGAGAQPFDELFTNLDYSGGPVMPSNTNYAVYWAPSGSPAYPADYQPGIDRYFQDIAHDSGASTNVESVSAQYDDAEGSFAAYDSHFGGAILDTHAYPANGCTAAATCLTDAQLQAELKRLVKADGLPRDLGHEYFLLTPPGVEDCLTGASRQCSAGSSSPWYCAYHGDVNLGPEGVIVYANDPYVTGNELCDDPSQHPNGTTSDGALIGGLSHEHNESITDPEPNSAWTDFGGSGGEIGDKCRTFEQSSEFGTPLGTAPDGSPYNQLINEHEYWYQQEWSNQRHECLQRLAFSGEEPKAVFSSAPAGGLQMTLDASASTAPGGVDRYEWQFNEGGSPGVPEETSEPVIVHSFAAAGVYDIALTVFAADGTSAGAGQSVVVGTPPQPVVTKVSPKKGPAGGGTLVKIIGTGFTGASQVLFGAAPATFSVMSASEILALAPGEAPATIAIRVSTPGGTSALTSADVFKFVPTVSAVEPSHGPRAGGTPVAVTGTGFATGEGKTVFHFGTKPATSVSCPSSTRCTMLTPAHEAATVQVHAIVNAIGSAKEAGDTYTYE